MTPLTQQLEDKKKEQYEVGELMNLDVDRYTFSKEQEERVSKILDYHIETVEKFNKIGNTDLTIDLENKYNILESEITILEQAIAEIKKQRQEISKSLRERIMRNGNLSNRIIETECGEFEHKHDYILNEIVCEIIEETLQQLNQPK